MPSRFSRARTSRSAGDSWSGGIGRKPRRSEKGAFHGTSRNVESVSVRNPRLAAQSQSVATRREPTPCRPARGTTSSSSRCAPSPSRTLATAKPRGRSSSSTATHTRPARWCAASSGSDRLWSSRWSRRPMPRKRSPASRSTRCRSGSSSARAGRMRTSPWLTRPRVAYAPARRHRLAQPGGVRARCDLVTVTGADLDSALGRLAAGVPDPRAGIFGPGSRVWTFNREAVIFLGGGRAALLQLAHPAVARAIADHSRTREDMLGRFLRTFEHVFALVYGDLESALASARRLHAIHSGIVGTGYAANQPETLLWVHATLWETSMQVYELVMGPVSRPQRDAYWNETRRFAALFGIPDALLPPDWAGFTRYWEDLLASDTIRVTTTARELADFLLRPPSMLLAPAWQWLRVMTARLLPPRLRHEFGLPFGALERATAEMSLVALRATWWLLPGGLRWLPAYRDGVRRVDGTPGRAPIGVLVDALARELRYRDPE